MKYFDWIKHHGARRPSKPALIDAVSGVRLTYGEFDNLVEGLTACFQRQFHLLKGDRIALLARTGIDSFLIQFACARAGIIFTPLNWRLSANELNEICEDAGPSVLLYHQEFENKAKGVPGVESRVIADGMMEGQDEALRTNAGGPETTIELDDPWCILYTSGTTGKPKGVVIPYRMIIANVLNFSVPTRITQDSVFLCAMPTFHTGGLNVYSNPIFHAGGTVITMGDFDADVAIEILRDHQPGVTHFFGTPTHYQMMSETKAFKTSSFPSLVNCGMGGSGLTGSLIIQWLDKGVPIQPTYGMTEIGPGILTTDLERVRETIGTSGRPSLHMDLMISDEHGNELPPRAIGEIWVRGPVVTSGYWKNTKATAEAFHDGWFKTGDLAYRDDEGFVYIVDRSKEMYVSGGENVYPAEVERAILEMPNVYMCGVVGVRNERWGEVGVAYVVAKKKSTLSQAAVLAHCSEKLARYKVPKHIQLLSDLPLTSSGKIDKNALRAMAEADNTAGQADKAEKQ